MERKELLLFIIPLLTLIFSMGEYWGWWDGLTSRSSAMIGYERLKSAEGFPKTWLYKEKSSDSKMFDALEERILNNTTNNKIQDLYRQNIRPSLITVGGNPIILEGLEPDMKKYTYSDIHPVMFIYGVSSIEENSKRKAAQACTLGELRIWIEAEKLSRQFWVITVIVGLLSFILIYIRLHVTRNIKTP